MTNKKNKYCNIFQIQKILINKTNYGIFINLIKYFHEFNVSITLGFLVLGVLTFSYIGTIVSYTVFSIFFIFFLLIFFYFSYMFGGGDKIFSSKN